MLTIEQSISRLKINLVRKRPFYGVILMKLNDMKESNTTNIMSTDGENIYYNKKYMEQLNEAERNFCQRARLSRGGIQAHTDAASGNPHASASVAGAAGRLRAVFRPLHADGNARRPVFGAVRRRFSSRLRHGPADDDSFRADNPVALSSVSADLKEEMCINIMGMQKSVDQKLKGHRKDIYAYIKRI